MIRLIRVLIFTVGTICSYAPSWSQQASNYIISTGTNASLAIDKNGNAIDFTSATNILPANTELNSILHPIGFNFVFMGKEYSHFVASSDGRLGLGIASSSAAFMMNAFEANDLTRNVFYPPVQINSAPILAAFWDDLRTATVSPGVNTVISGVSPNRCKTIQWNVVVNNNSFTVGNDATFQIRMYESTGEVEYVYGKMNIGASSGVVTASIGFTAGAGDNQFLALQNLSSFTFTNIASQEPVTQNLVNSSTAGPITSLNSSADGSRRYFRFAPPVLAGNFTNVFVSDVTANSMHIRWLDNFSNEADFVIYMSTDNINFNVFGTVPADSNRYIARGLANNTTYYWKVMAASEGSSKTSAVVSGTTHCDMNGVYSVGPNGQFKTITQAFDSLSYKGMIGPVIFELQNNYVSTGEVFPLVFPKNVPCRTASQVVTIRPAANATAVEVINSTTAALFTADSAGNIVIDGRPGGAGTVKALTLTSVGKAIIFKNSSSNTITYTNIRSLTSSATGVISLEGSAGAGTDNIIIDQCDIFDYNNTMPRVLLHSWAGAGVDNKNGQVTGCNLYNFKVMAVSLATGNKDWKIQNNSFYATRPVVVDSFAGGMIYAVDSGALVTYRVEDNYFGGSTPQCGGNVMDISGNSFTALYVGGNSSIKNNYFRRILFKHTVTNTQAYFRLIYATQPQFLLNNQTNTSFINDNIIGGAASADSVSMFNISSNAYSATLIDFSNVTYPTVDGTRCQNIWLRNPARTAIDFRAISSLYGAYRAIFTNNIVGSFSGNFNVANYTQGATVGMTVTGDHVDCRNNIVTGIRDNGGVTGMAIYSGGGTSTEVMVADNVVSHLASNRSEQSAIGGLAAVGMGLSSQASKTTFTRNKVFGLTATNTESPMGVTGLTLGGATLVSHNVVHSLVGSGFLNMGFDVVQGSGRIENNIIHLGTDSLGNTVFSKGGGFIALYQEMGATNVVVHNTFHIGGRGTSPGNKTSSTAISQAGNLEFYNNIVSLQRDDSNYTGIANRVFSVAATIPAQYRKYDNNIYYVNGKNTLFAIVQPYDKRYDSLQQWRMEAGYDVSSIEADPNYINPDASASQFNLHLASPTPAEGKGNAAQTTNVDWDNETRSNLTPVDMGMDAGNYVLRDNWRPVLTPDAVPGHHIDSVQRITVRIQEETGVDTGNTYKPRMWFRRFYPTQSNWFNVEGNQTAGSLTDGRWRFNINYQSVGLTITSSDSIECYFVAQDIAASRNVGYSPIRNNNHNDVAAQLEAPRQTYHYKISGPLADTMFVGAGRQYTSLTNDLGVFQAINAGIAKRGGVVVAITSDLTETGKYGLDKYPTTDTGGVLKIITTTPMVKSINYVYSNVQRDMINIKNSKKIIIDGSVNGAGRHLRFINTNVSSQVVRSAISLTETNKLITIQNIVVETNAQTSPAVVMGISDSVTFIGNAIKGSVGSPGTVGNMYMGLYTNGTTKGLKILNNEFSNFSRWGIQMIYASDSCTIDGNHFFNNATAQLSSLQVAIAVNDFDPAVFTPGTGTVVSNNYIGGSAPFCGGAPWTYSNASNTGVGAKSFIGITLKSSPTGKNFIYNNSIQNINISSTDNINFIGIVGSGLLDIGGRGGNIIGHPTLANSIQIAGASTTGKSLLSQGIKISDDPGSTIANNVIANIITTGNYMSLAGISADDTHTGTTIIEKNTIKNLVAGGSLGYATDPFSVAGIWLSFGKSSMNIRQNVIDNLQSNGNGSIKLATGILFNNTVPAVSHSIRNTISRNRISNIENRAASGATITGMSLLYGYHRIDNNQITLTNGSNNNPALIIGIQDKTVNVSTAIEPSRFYYNSILIGGSASTGDAASYAVNFSGNNATGRFRNNLLYNGRAGGTGNHLALGVNYSSNPGQFWAAGVSDFNFMVTADTTKVGEWFGQGVLDLRSFKSVSQGDASTYSSLTTRVPVDSLFSNAGTGNLNINTLRSHGWYVNGKGLPINDISADFDSSANVRSTTPAGGATDIGSDEFTPLVAPPQLFVYGRHIPGGSDTLSVNGHVTAVINWDNVGVLPVLEDMRWYSGVWPNDTTNNATVSNARFMNGYWQVHATGGSGYRYSITFFYDSAMLGKVTDIGSMLINKRQENVAGSWVAIRPAAVNATQKTITISNQNSFSEFTATDSAATLQTGVQLPDLVISGQQTNVATVTIGTIVNATAVVANQTGQSAGASKLRYYLSADNIITPGANGDLLLGESDIAAIAGQGNSGTISKVLAIPCTLTAGNYYLFFVADAGNTVNELTETNNSASVALAVTGTVVVPAVTINQSGCSSGSLTLQAAPTNGGTSPKYQWLVNNVAVADTTQTFTLTNPVNGTQVSCVLTSSVSCANPKTATASVAINCVTTSIPAIDGVQDFRIAPNPTTGVVTILLKLNQSKKVIFDINDHTGRVVYRSGTLTMAGSATHAIDLRAKAAGVYYLQTTIGNKTFTQKLIVAR